MPFFQKPVYIIFYYSVIFGGIFLPVLAFRFQKIKTFCMKIGIPVFSISFLPYFLLIFFIMNQKASLIKTYEISEFLVAFTFLLFIFSVCKEKKVGKKSCVLVISLTAMLFFVFPPSAAEWSYRYHANAGHYKERHLPDQAEAIYAFLMEREELLREQTFLDYGNLLVEQNKTSEAKRIFELGIKWLENSSRLDDNEEKRRLLKEKFLRQLNQV